MTASVAISSSSAAPEGWAELGRRIGCYYHEPEWIATLASAFGFRAHYLSARGDDGALVGILPLAEVRALSGRRRLVSLPFSYCAGPAATSETVAHALAARAIALASERGARSAEIKWMPDADIAAASGFTRVSRYAAYRLPRFDDETAAMRSLHKDHVQRGIRKAEREGVTVTLGDGVDDWRIMAALQAETSHRLGLPSPPERFFTEHCLRLQRSGLARVYVARDAERVIGALACWTGAREWIYSFGASRQDALEKRPNHALLWRALRDAIGAGVVFDLGRAAEDQPGLVQFKVRWGGVAHPLAYDYWPRASGLNTASRDSGPIAIVNRAWSALPLAVARRGSFLYKYLA